MYTAPLDTSFSSLVMNQAYKCTYCQCQLTPSTTTTNTNGNLGRRYVLCTAWPEGEFGPGKMSHQRYFRWVDRTPSPSMMAAQTLSPPLPSPPLTAPASTTTTFPPPLPFQLPTYCSFAGCKWKRPPARDCTRNMCRTHCQLSGGCPSERPCQQTSLCSLFLNIYHCRRFPY
jgi:hypothetical protein